MSDTFSFLAEEIQKSLQNNYFVKISLGNYKGSEPDIKNIYIKVIEIKKELNLSFTYRYKTKDIVKNYPLPQALELIRLALAYNQFRVVTLFTTQHDWAGEVKKDNSLSFKKQKPSFLEAPEKNHNKQKNRKISPIGKTYLHALNITDEKGEVYKNAQDKYKQINHYIELLSNSFREISCEEMHIVDMGAGKGYLTFALYDYIKNTLAKQFRLTGVEMRPDLVLFCNQIAQNNGFESLTFVQNSIQDFQTDSIDVLIALHACDTATDDAIAKGIKHNAELIVVAPCCHKQIRRQMEQQNQEHLLQHMTRHGIFLERQAEMITDSIRALLLELHGYQTKIFEFVSDLHTPKNVMIVGHKKNSPSEHKKAEILQKISDTKAFFGIKTHYLETLLQV
ncbi:MAG: SAM-dependent methyltransferase [Cytophagales bacterium]|nr:MAG: SAM-dependent methyltransferase [Cytophagales bacterium]TAF61081.1 MAG: SAM-dependent methyltransferase [Cytophagales bacterium]